MKIKTSDRITIWGIAITAILAILACIETYYLNSQQTEIKGFGNLLENTSKTNDKISLEIEVLKNQLNIFDSLYTNSNRNIDTFSLEIGILKNQLRLNEITQADANLNAAYTNKGNRYLFLGAIYKLGIKLDKKDKILKDTIVPYYYYINELKTILESQITNPYLFKNEALTLDWLKAYQQLYYYVDDRKTKGDFDNSFSSSDFNTGRQNLRIDEIDSYPNEDIGSCWEAANTAYETGVKCLIKDGIVFKFN